MEVMFVWAIVLSLILSFVHLGWRVYWWRQAVKFPEWDKLPHSEKDAAKRVFWALLLIPAALTGPLFLLGLLVYAVVLFFRALSASISSDN